MIGLTFINTFAISVGKPVVFSTGFYGTIPNAAYSSLLQTIRSQNVSVLSPSFTLTRKTFEKMCDDHEMDKLPLIAHSAIDHDILNSHRLEKVLLLDPATLPSISLQGLNEFGCRMIPITIRPRAPVNIILTRLYDTFVKPPFQPNIEGAHTIQLYYGGHSDLLDGALPWFASKIGIESDSEKITDYKSFVNLYIQEWLKSCSCC
tara:strand:+ start:80 stop:694 length:615 start_codon:yes stop_codon:yes gene_type:complete